MPVPEFLLNGRRVCAHGTGVYATLLDYIRDRGLTGAKEGCAEGECGACTVVMVADRAPAAAYRAVNSCLMLAADGGRPGDLHRRGTRADGKLAEVQQAMARRRLAMRILHAGFVMSLFAEQYRPGRAGPCDPHALGGNLCRCTGYRPIRDAALSLGPAPADGSASGCRSRRRRSNGRSYAIPRRAFSRPGSLAECLSIARGRSARAADLPAAPTWRSNPICDRALASPWSAWKALPELREFSEDADDASTSAPRLPLNEIALRWHDAPAGVPRMAASVRLAADPQSRHAGRQSGDGFAHRRFRAAAAGARRGSADRRPRRDCALFRCPHSSPATGRPRCSPAS